MDRDQTNEKKLSELVRESFTHASVECDDEDESMVLKQSGLAGINVLISTAVPEATNSRISVDDVSMDKLTAAYEELGWGEEMNLTWADMEKLLAHLEEKAMREQLADLIVNCGDQGILHFSVFRRKPNAITPFAQDSSSHENKIMCRSALHYF